MRKFEDLPSTNTPITAESLNQFENKLVVVSATEPTGDNREKVWIRKSKNYFIGGQTVTNNGVTFTKNVDGSYNIKGTATAEANCYKFVPIGETGIEQGEKYTVSINQSIPNGVAIMIEAYNGGTWLRHVLGVTSLPIMGATANITNCTQIRFGLRVNNGLTVDISNLKVLFEKGTEITEYEPYVIPAIYTLNNDSYQELIAKNNLEQYSTDEIRIGTWIDGKSIYRKVVAVNLTNSGETLYNHNISNIEQITNSHAIFNRKNNQFIPVPFSYINSSAVVQGSWNISYQVTKTAIQFFVGSSAYSEKNGNSYVIIEYTKTTDTPGISTMSLDEE